MKIVTATDLSAHESEILCSNDTVLVTRDGQPLGVFIPLTGMPNLPIEMRRHLFVQLSDDIGAQLDALGISEAEILADFAAERAARRSYR